MMFYSRLLWRLVGKIRNDTESIQGSDEVDVGTSRVNENFGPDMLSADCHLDAKELQRELGR